jgi:hypothetical protein
MIGSKRILVNEEEGELHTPSLVLIGEYRKKLQMKPRGRIGCIGSVAGHEVHDQSRQEYDMKLYQDYFLERPTYSGKFFKRRFRKRRSLYLRIAQAVEEHANYFAQRRNVAGALGFSCLQKVTAAYRQLAYVVPIMLMSMCVLEKVLQLSA